jgi:nucleoside-diphosphate-sugar epimerase
LQLILSAILFARLPAPFNQPSRRIYLRTPNAGGQKADYNMPPKLNAVTGATGLLGSHIVEQLAARGEHVRALVRPTSDTAFLRQHGVELKTGDLHDPTSLRDFVAGADIVYHCAAKVGDWGPWELYQHEVIDATANVLDACREMSVGRVLHVSSITVYGHPKPRAELITENESLGQNLWVWDYYCRAKIKAEAMCRQYHGNLTIVRPGWMYGPRDRNTLPRVVKALRAGRVKLLGTGDNLLNILHAADAATGAILAANHDDLIGQAYNLSSSGEITQRKLLDLLTDLLGLPRITKHMPFQPAFWIGFVSEVIGHLIRLKRPPHITRYGVSLVGRSTGFSTEKARTQLGWQPRVSIGDGLRETLDWFRLEEAKQKLASVAS